jgi:hypothetical protein
MKRIAQSINILTEVKVGNIRDEYGNETGETYNYKEYEVLDGDGNVLEVGQYTEDEITVEEILNKTGIAFGISAWFTND